MCIIFLLYNLKKSTSRPKNINNTISLSDIGIGVYGSDRNLIMNNNINGSFFCRTGVNLEFSDENIISENQITQYECGIMLRWSSYNTISLNSLIENEQCFYEDDNCVGNTFENNFCPKTNIGIMGYDLGILIGILSLISLIIIIKYRNKMSPGGKLEQTQIDHK